MDLQVCLGKVPNHLEMIIKHLFFQSPIKPCIFAQPQCILYTTAKTTYQILDIMIFKFKIKVIKIQILFANFQNLMEEILILRIRMKVINISLEMLKIFKQKK